MKLQHVPLEYVISTWPKVERFVDEASKFGEDYTTEQIKVYLATGQWTLAVFVDDNNEIQGAVALSFFNYPNDRIAFITFIGGKSIFTEDLLAQLKNLSMRFGATKIQGAVRDSVARLSSRLGFYKRYTIIETKI